MYRPAFTAKLRLNYSKTWTNVLRLVRQPEAIKPAPAPAHLQAALCPQQTVKLPQLKGNLVHTLKEIVRIFMAEWAKAPRAINLAIQTTRTALMKCGSNRDPKTAYRHILALIEYGFLRGKVQVKGGLQLLLNPALFVFDATPAVAQAALVPSVPVAAITPAPTPAQGLASLLAAAQKSTGNLWKTS